MFTLFGDFAGTDAEIPAAGLIRLMSPFGLSPAATRQALSRMSRQGWVLARRHGKRSFYALTERGRERVAAISPRIYGPLAEWDGQWRVLVHAANEGSRRTRDALRKDLTILGWAPLSPSTWISPNGDLSVARTTIDTHGVGRDSALFLARYLGPNADRDLIERCWNLPAIAQKYGEFIAAYEPLLKAERLKPASDEEHAFVRRLWLVYDYRKFTYVDPGLPSALLPAGWPGTIAASVFRGYYAAIAKPAQRFFNARCAG